jgi:hypothetical protein
VAIPNAVPFIIVGEFSILFGFLAFFAAVVMGLRRAGQSRRGLTGFAIA